MKKSSFKCLHLIFLFALLLLLLSHSIGAEEIKNNKNLKSASTVPEKRLHLSLKDTIIKSLENNLDIAIERYNPEIQETDITKEKSVFDPLFELSFEKSEEITPSTSRTIQFGGANSVDTESDTFTSGITKKFTLGTELNLEIENIRNADTFNDFKSEYETNITLNLTQPLLKDFGINTNKTNIYIAKNNRAISDETFRERVMEILSEVQNTYWELVFRIENLKVKQKSLRLAQELLERNKIQVEVGTLAPIEIVQAEASIAAREEDVIVAEDEIGDAEDRLKRILHLTALVDAWNVSIVPTDAVPFDAREISLPGSLEKAFKYRPDYARSKKELENAKIQSKFARNQLLPRVDFVAKGGYNALRGNLGNSVDDISSTRNPLWGLGVEVEIPILNREAKSQNTRRRLELEQAKTTLKNLEQRVIEEVRGAVRQLKTNIKRVHATKAARILAERQLDAEKRKLEVGMSTNFTVLEFQEDLSLAESNEAKAIIDYNKSLVDLDRILGTLLEKHNIVLKKTTI